MRVERPHEGFMFMCFCGNSSARPGRLQGRTRKNSSAAAQMHRATINEEGLGFVHSSAVSVVQFLVCVCTACRWGLKIHRARRIGTPSACSLEDDACSQESRDDHNERVETIITLAVTCDNKCQNKHARYFCLCSMSDREAGRKSRKVVNSFITMTRRNVVLRVESFAVNA